MLSLMSEQLDDIDIDDIVDIVNGEYKGRHARVKKILSEEVLVSLAPGIGTIVEFITTPNSINNGDRIFKDLRNRTRIKKKPWGFAENEPTSGEIENIEDIKKFLFNFYDEDNFVGKVINIDNEWEDYEVKIISPIEVKNETTTIPHMMVHKMEIVRVKLPKSFIALNTNDNLMFNSDLKW